MIPPEVNRNGTLRRPTLDENNRAFTAAVVGGGAIAGSTVSVLLSGALLAGLWRLWQGQIALPRDPRTRLIGAALASHFLAEALSTLVNFSGPTDLLEGVVANIPFLAFLIIFARLSLTPRVEILRWAEFGAVGGGIGAGIFALVQVVLLDHPRAEGLAGNPGPFALVSAVLVAFCVVAAIRNQGDMRRLAATGALFAAIAVLLSGMRSLWPMLVISPVLVLWLMGAVRPRLISAKVLSAGVLTALLVAAIGYSTVQQRVMSLATDIERVEEGNLDNSLGQRIRVWDAAVSLIAERPLFGYGPAHARAVLKAEAHDAGRPDLAFSHTHNMFLNAMVRSGIVGLLAQIAIFLVPVLVVARARKDGIGMAGFAILACLSATYLLNGLVNVSLGHDILDAVYIYCTIVASYLVLGASSVSRNAPSQSLTGSGRPAGNFAANGESRPAAGGKP